MPSRLGPAGRLRAALHVLRTGNYQPASAYLHGVRDGLDEGFALAWEELQRRFPGLGPDVRLPGPPMCQDFDPQSEAAGG